MPQLLYRKNNRELTEMIDLMIELIVRGARLDATLDNPCHLTDIPFIDNPQAHFFRHPRLLDLFEYEKIIATTVDFDWDSMMQMELQTLKVPVVSLADFYHDTLDYCAKFSLDKSEMNAPKLLAKVYAFAEYSSGDDLATALAEYFQDKCQNDDEIAADKLTKLIEALRFINDEFLHLRDRCQDIYAEEFAEEDVFARSMCICDLMHRYTARVLTDVSDAEARGLAGAHEQLRQALPDIAKRFCDMMQALNDVHKLPFAKSDPVQMTDFRKWTRKIYLALMTEHHADKHLAHRFVTRYLMSRFHDVLSRLDPVNTRDSLELLIECQIMFLTLKTKITLYANASFEVCEKLKIAWESLLSKSKSVEVDSFLNELDDIIGPYMEHQSYLDFKRMVRINGQYRPGDFPDFASVRSKVLTDCSDKMVRRFTRDTCQGYSFPVDIDAWRTAFQFTAPAVTQGSGEQDKWPHPLYVYFQAKSSRARFQNVILQDGAAMVSSFAPWINFTNMMNPGATHGRVFDSELLPALGVSNWSVNKKLRKVSAGLHSDFDINHIDTSIYLYNEQLQQELLILAVYARIFPKIISHNTPETAINLSVNDFHQLQLYTGDPLYLEKLLRDDLPDSPAALSSDKLFLIAFRNCHLAEIIFKDDTLLKMLFKIDSLPSSVKVIRALISEQSFQAENSRDCRRSMALMACIPDAMGILARLYSGSKLIGPTLQSLEKLSKEFASGNLRCLEEAIASDKLAIRLASRCYVTLLTLDEFTSFLNKKSVLMQVKDDSDLLLECAKDKDIAAYLMSCKKSKKLIFDEKTLSQMHPELHVASRAADKSIAELASDSAKDSISGSAIDSAVASELISAIDSAEDSASVSAIGSVSGSASDSAEVSVPGSGIHLGEDSASGSTIDSAACASVATDRESAFAREAVSSSEVAGTSAMSLSLSSSRLLVSKNVADSNRDILDPRYSGLQKYILECRKSTAERRSDLLKHFVTLCDAKQLAAITEELSYTCEESFKADIEILSLILSEEKVETANIEGSLADATPVLVFLFLILRDVEYDSKWLGAFSKGLDDDCLQILNNPYLEYCISSSDESPPEVDLFSDCRSWILEQASRLKNILEHRDFWIACMVSSKISVDAAHQSTYSELCALPVSKLIGVLLTFEPETKCFDDGEIPLRGLDQKAFDYILVLLEKKLSLLPKERQHVIDVFNRADQYLAKGDIPSRNLQYMRTHSSRAEYADAEYFTSIVREGMRHVHVAQTLLTRPEVLNLINKPLLERNNRLHKAHVKCQAKESTDNWQRVSELIVRDGGDTSIWEDIVNENFEAFISNISDDALLTLLQAEIQNEYGKITKTTTGLLTELTSSCPSAHLLDRCCKSIDALMQRSPIQALKLLEKLPKSTAEVVIQRAYSAIESCCVPLHLREFLKNKVIEDVLITRIQSGKENDLASYYLKLITQHSVCDVSSSLLENLLKEKSSGDIIAYSKCVVENELVADLFVVLLPHLLDILVDDNQVSHHKEIAAIILQAKGSNANARSKFYVPAFGKWLYEHKELTCHKNIYPCLEAIVEADADSTDGSDILRTFQKLSENSEDENYKRLKCAIEKEDYIKRQFAFWDECVRNQGSQYPRCVKYANIFTDLLIAESKKPGGGNVLTAAAKFLSKPGQITKLMYWLVTLMYEPDYERFLEVYDGLCSRAQDAVIRMVAEYINTQDQVRASPEVMKRVCAAFSSNTISDKSKCALVTYGTHMLVVPEFSKAYFSFLESNHALLTADNFLQSMVTAMRLSQNAADDVGERVCHQFVKNNRDAVAKVLTPSVSPTALCEFLQVLINQNLFAHYMDSRTFQDGLYKLLPYILLNADAPILVDLFGMLIDDALYQLKAGGDAKYHLKGVIESALQHCDRLVRLFFDNGSLNCQPRIFVIAADASNPFHEYFNAIRARIVPPGHEISRDKFDFMLKRSTRSQLREMVLKGCLPDHEIDRLMTNQSLCEKLLCFAPRLETPQSIKMRSDVIGSPQVVTALTREGSKPFAVVLLADASLLLREIGSGELLTYLSSLCLCATNTRPKIFRYTDIKHKILKRALLSGAFLDVVKQLGNDVYLLRLVRMLNEHSDKKDVSKVLSDEKLCQHINERLPEMIAGDALGNAEEPGRLEGIERCFESFDVDICCDEVGGIKRSLELSIIEHLAPQDGVVAKKIQREAMFKRLMQLKRTRLILSKCILEKCLTCIHLMKTDPDANFQSQNVALRMLFDSIYACRLLLISNDKPKLGQVLGSVTFGDHLGLDKSTMLRNEFLSAASKRLDFFRPHEGLIITAMSFHEGQHEGLSDDKRLCRLSKQKEQDRLDVSTRGDLAADFKF